MYKLPVDDLREKLSHHPANKKHPAAWMAISVLVFIFPFFIGMLFILILLRIA